METDKASPKNEVLAKQALAEYLRSHSYDNVRIARSPADIIAEQVGQTHLFEVKFTGKRDNYFGAATLSEWEAATQSPDRFWFVVAQHYGAQWHFTFYTPKEFLEFSYVPPFKVFFNVPLTDRKSKRRAGVRPSKRLGLTEPLVLRLIAFYGEIRKEVLK